VNSSFGDIEFIIEGRDELPSPKQLLKSSMPSQLSSGSSNDFSSIVDLSSSRSRNIPSLDGLYGMDWTHRDHGRLHDATA